MVKTVVSRDCCSAQSKRRDGRLVCASCIARKELSEFGVQIQVVAGGSFYLEVQKRAKEREISRSSPCKVGGDLGIINATHTSGVFSYALT